MFGDEKWSRISAIFVGMVLILYGVYTALLMTELLGWRISVVFIFYVFNYALLFLFQFHIFFIRFFYSFYKL